MSAGVAIRRGALRHALLGLSATFILIPFAVMLGFLFLSPPSAEWTGITFVDNLARAFAVVPFARFMLNGIVVALVTLAGQVVIAAPCAYALAKLEFPGRDLLFWMVVLGLAVPTQVLALPLFLMLNRAGLLDTYAALIIPFLISPFGIFLFRQVFKAVPDDIIHAARLDGMSEGAIVWRIMIPIALPSVAAFSILSIISRWNSLFWPTIAVTSESLMPPVLGILYFRNSEAGDEFGALMAAALIVVLPLVGWFLLAQRRFVEGLTLGAVK